jgi:hypothetical protein
MPTLLEYINQLQREHKYRVKMVFQPSEKQLESLERHLKKYDALEVGRPEKLMLQATPRDFPQHGGHEIVQLDVVTRLPASQYSLTEELVRLLDVPDGTLKVFDWNEPFMKDEELKEVPEEYEVLTGSDYTEAEKNPVKPNDISGDEYVEEFVKNASKDDGTKPVLATKTDAKANGPIMNDKTKSTSPLSKVNNPLPKAKGK